MASETKRDERTRESRMRLLRALQALKLLQLNAADCDRNPTMRGYELAKDSEDRFLAAVDGYVEQKVAEVLAERGADDTKRSDPWHRAGEQAEGTTDMTLADAINTYGTRPPVPAESARERFEKWWWSEDIAQGQPLEPEELAWLAFQEGGRK